MTWPPARFIAHVVEAAAPHQIPADSLPVDIVAFVREFFETLIRVRAGDERVYRHSDAVRLVALYDPMTTSAAFENLTELNRFLHAEDGARYPPASHGAGAGWEPLSLIAHHTQRAASALDLFEIVKERSESLAEILALREVIEAVISVRCADTRRSYLSGPEHAVLAALAEEGADTLIESYSRACSEIQRLGLNNRITFNPFA